MGDPEISTGNRVRNRSLAALLALTGVAFIAACSSPAEQRTSAGSVAPTAATCGVKPSWTDRPKGSAPIASETPELVRRQNELHADMKVVSDFGASVPGEYGGAFLDVPDGQIVVAFVHDGEANLSKLRPLVSSPERVRLVAADKTWVSLLESESALRTDMQELTSKGARIRAYGPDARSNRVVVTIDADDAVTQRLLCERPDADRLAFETASGIVTAQPG